MNLGNPTADDVPALLAAILAELRTMNANAGLCRVTLPRDDLETLGALLPAIAGARGSETFLIRDLEEEHPELRPLMAGRTVKQLGRLFARAEGLDISGYVVRRAGLEISTQLWEVLAVRDSVSSIS